VLYEKSWKDSKRHIPGFLTKSTITKTSPADTRDAAAKVGEGVQRKPQISRKMGS
jgi:hypothetical protein